jgi:hypothetical protein
MRHSGLRTLMQLANGNLSIVTENSYTTPICALCCPQRVEERPMADQNEKVRVIQKLCGFGFLTSDHPADPLPANKRLYLLAEYQSSSPARASGLRDGDKFIAFRIPDGEWNNSFKDIPTGELGLSIDLRVLRPTTQKTLDIRMRSSLFPLQPDDSIPAGRSVEYTIPDACKLLGHLSTPNTPSNASFSTPMRRA